MKLLKLIISALDHTLHFAYGQVLSITLSLCGYVP